MPKMKKGKRMTKRMTLAVVQVLNLSCALVVWFSRSSQFGQRLEITFTGFGDSAWFPGIWVSARLAGFLGSVWPLAGAWPPLSRLSRRKNHPRRPLDSFERNSHIFQRYNLFRLLFGEIFGTDLISQIFRLRFWQNSDDALIWRDFVPFSFWREIWIFSYPKLSNGDDQMIWRDFLPFIFWREIWIFRFPKLTAMIKWFDEILCLLTFGGKFEFSAFLS